MLKKINEWMVRFYINQDMRMYRIKKKFRDERGATAVEYALVIAVIVVMVIGAATLMRDPLEKFFKAAIKKVVETFGIK